MVSRGKFITFEGLDGVGKSTQMKNLAKWLRDRGISVVSTREPGGTPLGQKLRTVLLSSRTSGLSPLAELALMFADRAQHIDQLIMPSLDRGEWVLCDRFTDSSEAYQGGGRQLGSDVVRQLHRLVCHDLRPDLTILMLGDPIASLDRARKRNVARARRRRADENRFEQESRAFHHRVLESYQAIAAREPQRVVKIEAHHAVPEVHQEIVRHVQERFAV